MLAEEALWDDQNHMLTYVHWIILWITSVLTSEIASSWTWALLFLDVFGWFFDGVIVLSNLLPYSCIREEISYVCVVGWWHWRGPLLHDWSIQVFYFVWTYMLAEEALWDDQNHMLTYVHWIILWITYVLTSEIASSWTWALLFLDVFGWFFDRVIVLSNLLPYSCICEEISCVCVVGWWHWRGSLLHDWSIPVFHFVWLYMGVSKNSGTPKSSISIGFSIINHPFWGTPIFGHTHMLAEEALWDDQNHMLTYVHWIILWITYVLTSEIASSWTWALLFLDVFGWFFDRVIVLSNLLPYSCIREEISSVVGGWHWRVSLLHDWSRQVFHFAWTYIHVSKGSTLGWPKSHANLCPLNLLVDYIRPNIWNCFQLNLSFAVFGCVWLILWPNDCTFKSFAIFMHPWRDQLCCWWKRLEGFSSAWLK